MAVRLKNTGQNISYVVLQKPETSQPQQTVITKQPKPCMKVLTYPDGSTTNEYVIRAPKGNKRKYSLMKFEYSGNLDFNRLGDAVIQRENNLKAYKQAHDIDSAPKFGEGSEYRKEEKEEARRKKYGIRRQNYNPEDQPWILNLGSKERQKRFKGVRAGGASDNASYYIFTQCPDGAFEAFPISDWHIFKPCPKYNHLTAEEAEEEFKNRDNRLSRLSVKVLRQIRHKNEEEEGEEKEKEKKARDLMLTELDDWGGSDKESGDNDEDGDSKKKKGKKKVPAKKKNQRKNSDDEAMDDSDDGDMEEKELDYMTDTDSEDENMYEDKRGKEETTKYEEDGVADEDGLKNLLNSEDEEEEEKPEDKENNEEEKEKKNTTEKKKKGNSEELMSDSSSSSDSSDDSADSDPETGVTSPLLLQKKKKTPPESRSATPTNPEVSNKRKADNDLPPPNSKKARAERIIAQVEKANASVASSSSSSSLSYGKGESTLTVENVRRYLMRKPMTTTDLLKKFKNKNQNLSKTEFSSQLTEILKKINPDRKKVNEVLYLSIPSDKSGKTNSKE